MNPKIKEALLEKYEGYRIIELPDIIYIGGTVSTELLDCSDIIPLMNENNEIEKIILYSPDCLNIIRNLDKDVFNLRNINVGLFLIDKCIVEIKPSIEYPYINLKFTKPGTIEDLRRTLLALELEFEI